MVIEHETPPEYPESETEYHRQQDINENLETTPPEGEEVLRPVLMLAECFVGGDLDNLIAGCRALDSVSRTGGLRIGLADVKAELPGDFERVLLKAYAPTPSVVVVVATFVLRPDAARLLDEELRTNRYLRLEKQGRITRYSSAAHRKSDAVIAERTRVKTAGATWLAQNFAGTLSTDFQLDGPTIDFYCRSTVTATLGNPRLSRAGASARRGGPRTTFGPSSPAVVSPTIRETMAATTLR
jgi:hypothetical protein